jgi:threonine/homoserine/homoserine lactone efflux protein
VDASTWLSLAGICIMGAASPGPSLGVVLANTVGGGRAAGVATGVGHGIGVGIYAALAVAGVAVIVTTAPPLFIGLQIAGAAFLIWMGAQLLRPPAPPDPASTEAPARPRKSVGQGFRQGFLVSFLNPKIAVFFLALFSQFVDPEAGLAEKGAMGLLAGGIDTAWYVLVALVLSGTGLAGWLEARARAFDVAMALVLLLVGLGVIARIAWAALAG